MKKFIPKLLLLSGVAIAIASCSKKDSASPTGNLVGKWAVVSDTTRTYDSKGNLLETDANSNIQASDYIQFNKDASGVESEFGFTVNFTYTISGSTLHLVYKSSNVPGGTIDNPNQDVDIKQLDAHTFWGIETETDTENGVTYTTKESIHFKK